MKIDNPLYRSQVKVVRGDCSQPGLGMDKADVNRIESEINVVVHLAATASSDSDPTLHEAVRTNVRATRDLISLAKRLPNLKVGRRRSGSVREKRARAGDRGNLRVAG